MEIWSMGTSQKLWHYKSGRLTVCGKTDFRNLRTTDGRTTTGGRHRHDSE